MIWTAEHPLPCFRFSNLSGMKGISHGLFTRLGGASTGDFRGLNVGIAVGDQEETVLRNRKEIARALNAPEVVYLHQIHSDGVVVLPRHNVPLVAGADAALHADAMITDVPGKFLAIQTADCQAVLLHDPCRKVVGAVHAGWRGSIANILCACVKAMETEFGSRPETILAGISPSLGPCCAEFIHYDREIPEALWRFKGRSPYFDFWAITRHQLVRAGLLPEHIETAGICTKCNPHLFFSYRGSRRTGRMASVIGLISDQKRITHPPCSPLPPENTNRPPK